MSIFFHFLVEARSIQLSPAVYLSARGAALGLRPAKKQIEADAQTPAKWRSQKVAFASRTSVLLWQAKSSGIQAYILACTTHADSFTAAA